MAATNRYMNTSAVGWTPSGGSLATLTGIKSFAYDEGGESLLEAADFDLFDTVGGINKLAPKVTLETIDAMALYATVAGTKGTLVATVRDFTNGVTASGGAKTFTVSNAFLKTRPSTFQFRQLGTQTLTFETTSTDGATHPVAVSAV